MAKTQTLKFEGDELTVTVDNGVDAKGNPMQTSWTVSAGQLGKHRAMFPEIEADNAVKAKADAVVAADAEVAKARGGK